MVPAGFQDVQEAHEVALEVGIRIGDGIPHPRLCGEIDHRIEALRVKERVQRFLVRDVHLQEALALPCAELGDAALLETDVIVVVEVVDADDLVAPPSK